jgi:NADH-quinone oxidoreductase subunit G
MDKMINLKIDGRDVTVPAGTLVVDAAKMAGITIPVFCYHPKLEPVGMCRMCLVDIGRPAMDRATGQPVLNEDGTPKITFGPKLDTACTTPVSEGMVVWGATEKVMAARKDILEFLLTSHPLDCPVCDKGGECPLQNQTMSFGPGESHFIFDEKHHDAKHIPLGDLITLDRERCIQCARCVRFSDQLAGDPVIGFYKRGRDLEIVTCSEPGFDSIFSGNTTDICPVGALTTADFRFGARPWEMSSTSSICTHCPVGCNISYSVRREASSNGRCVVKRVLPRQNEAVNELWICDKGRFGYHYAEDPERITTPLIRKDGKLVHASWEQALQVVADNFKAAGKKVVTLAGGRLANEDLYTLKQFSHSIEGKAWFYASMGGAEWTKRLGLVPGSDIGKLGKGSAVLVFASDLHEEAPIWWLRLKAAAERGAAVIVVAARQTRLDKYAAQVIRYKYGEEEKILKEFIAGKGEAAKTLAAAADAIVFYGADGLGLPQSAAVAGLCAELLVKTNHFGRPNNGLVAVWPHANDQGAAELGWEPAPDLAKELKASVALYVCAADPVGDSPVLAEAVQQAGFVVAQGFFLTETAKLANVVLPAQTVMEREGTLVSGERRVQRFHAAVAAPGECKADHEITALIAEKMGLKGFPAGAQAVFAAIAAAEPSFAGLTYERLAQTEKQWPLTGRPEAYFSGTAVENKDGLGVTLELSGSKGAAPELQRLPDLPKPDKGNWLAVPVTRLYDRGATVLPTGLLKERIGEQALSLHPADAAKLGLAAGQLVILTLGKRSFETAVGIDPGQPQGVLLVRRSMGIPLTEPAEIKLQVPTAVENEIR